jgi:hypothetical protein
MLELMARGDMKISKVLAPDNLRSLKSKAVTA